MSNLDPKAVQSYKAMTAKYVLPVMALTSIIFFITHYRNSIEYLTVIILGIAVAILNAATTRQTKDKHIFGFKINLRSDKADACRWFVSLVLFDSYMMYVLKPTPAIFVVTWLVLLLSAQADLFNRRLRWLVIGSATFAGSAILKVINPSLPLNEHLYLSGLMMVIPMILLVTERFWIQEMARRSQAEDSEREARVLMATIQRDAEIGAQSRIIAHELLNLITIVDLSTYSKEKIDYDRLRRSLEFIKRINSLVLDDLQTHVSWRECSVKDLIQDIELLIAKQITRSNIQFEIFADATARSFIFSERAGSTFFIIRNLLKNAKDAVMSLSGREKDAAFIKLRFEVLDEESMKIIVEDNGEGFTFQGEQIELDQLISQRSRKLEGHGLGLRFVQEECYRNNFNICFVKNKPHGARVEVYITSTPKEDIAGHDNLNKAPSSLYNQKIATEFK